jgi:hypothetical protein
MNRFPDGAMPHPSNDRDCWVATAAEDDAPWIAARRSIQRI